MKPAFSLINSVNIRGKPAKRLMVVLKTKGCEYALKSGGCTMCGFKNSASKGITDKDIELQLEKSIGEVKSPNEIEEIDLLTLGSFFNDSEISPKLRSKLLKKLNYFSNIKRIVVESRAEYVSVEKLRHCKTIVGQKILELGIGLESSDDYIRNTVLQKGLSKNDFEGIFHKAKQAGCDILSYLLINPPYLSINEAIKDAVSSAQYVFNLANKHNIIARVAFEPVFVCKDTPLEELFLNKRYRLINLWNVIAVIKKTYHLGNIFIGLSDENLSFDRMPWSCKKCYKKITHEIELFNKTQNICGLDKLSCDCNIQ